MEKYFVDPNDMIGEEFEFFGANLNEFKINGIIYEAVEDEDDGLRSMMSGILKKEEEEADGIFFDQPIASVCLEGCYDNYFEGFQLVDTDDGHIWLRFGTDYNDDYYPCFVFEYNPKDPEGEIQ